MGSDLGGRQLFGWDLAAIAEFTAGEYRTGTSVPGAADRSGPAVEHRQKLVAFGCGHHHDDPRNALTAVVAESVGASSVAPNRVTGTTLPASDAIAGAAADNRRPRHRAAGW